MRALAAVLLLVGCAPKTPVQAQTPSERTVPKRAQGPLELIVADLDGRAVDVASLEGTRVIEFWATWCRPCIEHRDELEAFAHEVEDQGVRVIAVSIDQRLETLRAHLENKPTSLEVLWDPAGQGSLRYTKLRLGHAVPTLVVVADDDRVVGLHHGYRENNIDILRSHISSL